MNNFWMVLKCIWSKFSLLRFVRFLPSLYTPCLILNCVWLVREVNLPFFVALKCTSDTKIFPRSQNTCDVIGVLHFDGQHGGQAEESLPGKFCAAGRPGGVSCNNTNATPGVSMHLFPTNKVSRNQWLKFVRRHCADFQPTKTSVLCSVQFTPDCVRRRIDLIDASENVSKNRYLKKGSFPTIDPTIDAAIEQQEWPVSTDWERRMVSVECNVDLLEYRSIQWGFRWNNDTIP